MLKKRFENAAGKVVFITVESASFAHPKGTLKVSAYVYPVGPGSYSSFINTSDSLDSVTSAIDAIGNRLVAETLYGSKEIYDALNVGIKPFSRK